MNVVKKGIFSSRNLAIHTEMVRLDATAARIWFRTLTEASFDAELAVMIAAPTAFRDRILMRGTNAIRKRKLNYKCRALKRRKNSTSTFTTS